VLVLVTGLVAWVKWNRARASDELARLIEQVVPGARVVPRGETLEVSRGGKWASVDLNVLADAFGDASDDEDALAQLIQIVADAVMESMGDEEIRAIVDEVKEHLRQRHPNASIELENDDSFVVRFSVGPRTFLHESIVMELWGLSDQHERRELIDTIVADRTSAATDPAESDRDRVRPRFKTPGRRARHDALIMALAAREGVSEVQRPPDFERVIHGLPYPIDYILDFEMQVMPLHEPVVDGEELSREALHALALENLRVRADSIRIPREGLSVLEDPHDHGAARVLLVPPLLDEDASVLAVAPSHAELVLFAEGDTAAAREAHALFQDPEADAPLPEPVRVTARGFETLSWADVLSAGA